MTKVVHCKKEPYDIYIGRPSKWGNPFTIGKDGTREEVILKYIDWLEQQPQLLAQISELKGKTLGCWCHPKPCHGDITGRVTIKVNRFIDYGVIWDIYEKTGIPERHEVALQRVHIVNIAGPRKDRGLEP